MATMLMPRVLGVCLIATSCLLMPGPAAAQGTPAVPTKAEREPPESERQSLIDAVVRLPLAAALGAALAMRPRRAGTPARKLVVVQTQVVLAVIGALVMVVVGASLARAFGVVGIAGLIRYRAKIDDPKDAGVMLCTLAIGLSSGVGLFALSTFSTFFILVVLSVIESFEPQTKKTFELSVGGSEDAKEFNAGDLRARLEAVLERFNLEYELRTTSPEKIVYHVKVPFEVETETVTNAILALDKKTPPTVKWDDKAAKAKS